MVHPRLTVVRPPKPFCPCRCYRRKVEIEVGHPLVFELAKTLTSCIPVRRNGLRTLETTSDLG